MLVALPHVCAAQSAPASPQSPLVVSLRDVVDRVVTRSTSVLLAKARRDEADASVGKARAARLPTITTNAQFTWQPTARAAGNGLTWAPNPTAPLEERVAYLERTTPAAGLAALPPQLFALAARYSWIGGLSGQATLLDGGRIRAGIAGATARRGAADAAMDAEQARARLDAELAYRQLIHARERVTVASASRETMARDLEATCSRWTRGVSSELDVLRSEMQLADLDRRRADAVAAERSADLHLRLLADLPIGPTLDLSTPVDTVAFDALANVEPTALLDAVHAANRRVAEATVAAASADVRATRAQRRPSLLLRADLQALQAPAEPFSLNGGWTKVNTVTAAIQMPLLRPGHRSDVRAAQARLAQASVDARRVADGVTGERSSVRAERERARLAWQSGRARLAAAERSANLTDAAAARGIATTTDQSRARLDVLEARTQVLEALIDYLSADAVASDANRSAPDQS
jgi:outer membrane protein TolC